MDRFGVELDEAFSEIGGNASGEGGFAGAGLAGEEKRLTEKDGDIDRGDEPGIGIVAFLGSVGIDGGVGR